ncbi:sensor histidine kinase [Kocuria tytonicola]|uniref:Sensor histidine kinase n=1 Tax=Kocuria tytonicola TaxID=2055946 RepID=A0A3L9L664_9MICC|nr:sensor histidine kinase [Kocuria tytonicola]RLY94486.1 sensor histidine kinase [Kocuria tytonicola]
MSTSANRPREARTPEPHHERTDLLYAAVWLLFLLFPVAALLQSTAATGLKALGLTGLVLFAALYTVSWIRQILVPRLSPLLNAVLWSAVLLLALLLVVPASPWSLSNTAPFFVALFVFRLPLRQGLPASVVVAVLALVPALTLLPPNQLVWPLFAVLPAWLIILASRVAMERSEAHERLTRELAVSRQREEVGRDVHDILGHSLTVITVKTQLAQRLVETDPRRAVAELDDVLALSREALTDVRSTVDRMRELDLGVELVQARAALRAAGITPHLPSSVPPMDDATRSAFAWILREAVTNVVRHSGASRCRVTVTSSSLRIEDDGARARGLVPTGDAASSRSGDTGAQSPGHELREGNGIRGMRERARAAGCEVTVTRNPRGGTTVEVFLA